MIDTVEPLTAQAKLALSRAQLLGAMGFEEVKDAVDGSLSVVDLPRTGKRSAGASFGARVGRSVIGRWWRRQPLSSVVQLGQPFLETYAQRHPGRLIACGAGAGALLWLVKPWKLLSVATVVTLLLKSSDIAGVVSDLSAKATQSGQDSGHA